MRGANGKDRTFSAPILTVLAIAGKLGAGAAAWRRVPQLPFELAACPHQWFQWLRLPVVSYALPALIAIGQVRHHHCPTRNPLARVLRDATRARTLRTLTAIQPSSGGFLEAVPLTAFVVMSLVASDRAHHPVVARGVRFLRDSQRADGSWPIDSNLTTWVTTLSIAALANQTAAGRSPLSLDRDALRRWLLCQQHRVEHPYTHAAPGGWAWTDLPGSVPDADDTPGALVALAQLDEASRAAREEVRESAELGVRWLLDLQNRDGGIPTFCRGWGVLAFDRSSPDLTAHTLLAWDAWRRELPPTLAARMTSATDRAVAFLSRVQRPDGAWVPLWFGNERAPDEENPTYGTARVLIALAGLPDLADRPAWRWLAIRGCIWVVAAQNADGGWGGSRGVPSSIEETSLAVHALAATMTSPLGRLLMTATLQVRIEPLKPRRFTRFQAAALASRPRATPPPSPAPITTAAAPPVDLRVAALTRGVEWLIAATRRGHRRQRRPSDSISRSCGTTSACTRSSSPSAPSVTRGGRWSRRIQRATRDLGCREIPPGSVRRLATAGQRPNLAQVLQRALPEPVESLRERIGERAIADEQRREPSV